MPHDFEHFHFPEMKFQQPSDPAEFEKRLKQTFAKEHEVIEKYFADLKALQQWIGTFWITKEMPQWIQNIGDWFHERGKEISQMTMAEYFDSIDASSMLRAVLLSQWGDYGLPPSQASAIILMTVASHYLGGAYYPEGGAQSIPSAVQEVLSKNGSQIWTNSEATEIIYENKRVIGMKVKNVKTGEEQVLRSSQVFSDIGAYLTYKNLVPNVLPQDQQTQIENLEPGYSLFTLFIGFKESPSALGFHGENHWIYDSIDHQSSFDNSKDILGGKVWSGYLSFPSLKDPKHPGGHTAELLTPIPYDVFTDWIENECGDSIEEFKKRKEQVTEAILNFLEEKFPGFKDLVEFTDLATPVTYEKMANHRKGEIYSIPPTVDRFHKMMFAGVRTPVKGLYLTGSDASTHGIVGAMMGGFMAAAASIGLSGYYKIGSRVNQG
jgi:all-trans-retinol 13,14-reductase